MVMGIRNMDKLLYGFFFFFLMLTGFLIQSGVATLDTSAWNFAGAGFAKAVMPHLGLIFLAISIAGIVIVALGGRRR